MQSANLFEELSDADLMAVVGCNDAVGTLYSGILSTLGSTGYGVGKTSEDVRNAVDTAYDTVTGTGAIFDPAVLNGLGQVQP